MSICTVGISCEQVKYCEHGINIALQECLFCKMQKQITALTDMYKHLSLMVARCQDHHIRQIDENRKISRRVDELERIAKRHSEIVCQSKLSPFKCPVCGGIGINCIIGEFRGLPIKTDKCKSCEGKGIIWG